MSWNRDIRSNSRSQSDLDEALKKKIHGRENLKMKRELLNKLDPISLLPLMPSIYIGTKEKIQQRQENKGRMLATGLFLDEICRFNGWALEFLDALHYTGFSDIARTLEPGYVPPDDDDFDNPDDGARSDDNDNDDDDDNGDSGRRDIVQNPLSSNEDTTAPKSITTPTDSPEISKPNILDHLQSHCNNLTGVASSEGRNDNCFSLNIKFNAVLSDLNKNKDSFDTNESDNTSFLHSVELPPELQDSYDKDEETDEVKQPSTSDLKFSKQT